MISFLITKKFKKYYQINIKKFNLLKPEVNFTNILLIHGKADTFVPFFMSKMIKEVYDKRCCHIDTLF